MGWGVWIFLEQHNGRFVHTKVSLDYNEQNLFPFFFFTEILKSQWGLKNSGPNKHKKEKKCSILVVEVK